MDLRSEFFSFFVFWVFVVWGVEEVFVGWVRKIREVCAHRTQKNRAPR